MNVADNTEARDPVAGARACVRWFWRFVGLVLVCVCVLFGSGLGAGWVRFGSGLGAALGPGWARFGPGVLVACLRSLVVALPFASALDYGLDHKHPTRQMQVWGMRLSPFVYRFGFMYICLCCFAHLVCILCTSGIFFSNSSVWDSYLPRRKSIIPKTFNLGTGSALRRSGGG